MKLNDSDVEEIICAVLRGEAVEWPATDPEAAALFLNRSEYHGVQPLLHLRMQEAAWPALLVDRLRERAIAGAMWEMRHRHILRKLLSAFERRQLRPVLLKGTALAYSLYPSAVLRTRSDTDLLIPSDPRSRQLADEALLEEGFVRESGVAGDLISYQATYTLREATGASHAIDLHWRVNNSELLSRLFSYEELLARAGAVEDLGPGALLPAPVDSLLLACMHRATHAHNPYYVDGVGHYGADRQMWLYDVHLLARTFTPEHWIEFMRLAEGKGLRSVCLQAFKRTRACFRTQFPPEVLDSLSRAGRGETTARYFGSGALRRMWMEFKAIPGSRQRLRFLRELVFPSVEYMRGKYPSKRQRWVGWLYARRFVDGAGKRLRVP